MDAYEANRYREGHPDSIKPEDQGEKPLTQKEIDRITERLLRTPVSQIFK
jgi:hypothetical protein